MFEDDSDDTEFCLCGRKMYPGEGRSSGFCSKDCEREYDAMMAETWNEIYLHLVEPQGSA